MMREMGTAWFFPRTRQVWAKCEKCRDWNTIDVKLRDFKPTPEKPYETKCGCNAKKTITKIQFARKNMKKRELISREKNDISPAHMEVALITKSSSLNILTFR